MSRPCDSFKNALALLRRDAKDTWEEQSPSKEQLRSHDAQDWINLCKQSQVFILLASAKDIRNCSQCKTTFTNTFGMPTEWWSNHYRNSNGYFSYAEQQDSNGGWGLNTWAYFESKEVNTNNDYKWIRLNMFTRWNSSPNQISILLFDMDPQVKMALTSSLKKVQSDDLDDPFWPYSAISSELVRLEDAAVWAVRGQVREIETKRMPRGKPDPNYRHLHDIARHAIHVTETLDVITDTLDSVAHNHKDFKSKVANDKTWHSLHLRLQSDKQMLASLRHRSASNEKRLQNEMQLAFQNVAQYDSGLSLHIAKASQIDSAAMKTISLLTLIFLPPTFICSLFSMSFFNYDDNSGWSISNQFWIYWAFAAPTTLIVSVVCYYWQIMFPTKFDVDKEDDEINDNNMPNSHDSVSP